MAMKVQGGRMVPAETDPTKGLKRIAFIRMATQTTTDLSNMRSTLSASDAFTAERFETLRNAERLVLKVINEVRATR